jgi:hypothetical protein
MVIIFACLYTSMSWKATKWVEIRFKTMGMEDKSFVTRLSTYFTKRQTDDEASTILQSLMKSSSIKTNLKKVLKNKEEEKESSKPKKVHYKYDAGSNQMNNAKKDYTKYLPAIVLWAARLNMFILSYMYHT